MAHCKKHGDIGNRTIEFSFPIQPVIKQKGKDIKLEPYDVGKTFCLECLMVFLEKKIGVVQS